MEINGFKILEDYGAQGKHHFLPAECKICFNAFKVEMQSLKRPNRLSCSRKCKNEHWLNNLKESNGFKILKTGDLIKGKRMTVIMNHQIVAGLPV